MTLTTHAATASLIRRYTAFQITFSLLLWLPIFYEFQRRAGMSDAQIFGIQSLYYLVFCLLEIPTGILADIRNPRFCMRLGAFVLTVANVLPPLVPNYAGFLCHFLLIALARSLVSGASSAYLYDALKLQNATEIYKTVEGRARSVGLVIKVGGWALMGFLMAWNVNAPYWLTSGASLISFVCALGLPVPAARESKTVSLVGLLRPALALVISSRWLMLVMLQGIGIFVMERIVSVNLFQPVLAVRGFPVGGYGIVMSVMTIFEALGAASPGFVRRFWSDWRAVFVLTLIMALSVGGLALHWAPLTVFFLCTFSLGCGMAFPIQRQLMNDAIPDSTYRATLLSMESLVDRAVCAVLAGSLAGFLALGHMDAFLISAAGAFALLVVILQIFGNLL